MYKHVEKNVQRIQYSKCRSNLKSERVTRDLGDRDLNTCNLVTAPSHKDKVTN